MTNNSPYLPMEWDVLVQYLLKNNEKRARHKITSSTHFISLINCSLVLLLKISLQLVRQQGTARAFHLCLSLLHSGPFTVYSYAVRRSCRNHVREISANFKDPARVGLAFLKKIVIFWTFQNGSIKLLGITSEENWFLIS